MLFKLSYKNIRKSMKDYLVFFCTLIIGIMTFYIFSALSKQTVMMELKNVDTNTIEVFKQVMDYISIFVAVVLGILIVYASNFLMKRRKKEFAIYMIIGMRKTKIAIIMFFETIIMGVVSLGVGLVFGTLLSQGMSVVTIKLFEADMSSYKFVISGEAIEKTILYFVIMYIVVIISEIFVVGRAKLINLLNAGKKSEKRTNKNPYICFVVGLVAIGLLAHAYIVSIGGIAKIINGDMLKPLMIEGAIGTILFFWALSGLIIFLSNKNKKFYLKGLRAFSSKEISSRMNTNIIAGSIICIMMFVTICMITCSFAVKNSMNKSFKENVTRDVCIYANILLDIRNKYPDEDGTLFECSKKHSDEYDDKLIEKRLKEKNVLDMFKDKTDVWTYTMNLTLADYIKDVHTKEAEAYKNDPIIGNSMGGYHQVIKISDYNKLAKAYGKKEVSLNENEYIAMCDFEERRGMVNTCLKANVPIKIGDKTYSPKYKECQQNAHLIMSTIEDCYDIIMIVPDSVDINKLCKNTNILVASYNNNFKVDSKYKSVDEYVSSEEFFKDINNLKDSDLEGGYTSRTFNVASETSLRKSTFGLTAIVAFVGVYLGIIFMITSAAILGLKTLSNATDNVHKYAILRRVGVSEKMISSSLFLQNLLFFGIPIVLAIVHSIFGIKFIRKLMEGLTVKASGGSIITGALVVIFIYGIYFWLTNLTSRKIISENR